MKTTFSFNNIQLLGHISSDPKVKKTQNGTTIIEFSLATNRSVKNGDEYEDRVTFHRIVCIGKGAEWLSDRLSKGQKIFVTGRQENRQYEKDGERKYISEVFADAVTPFLSQSNSKNTSDSQSDDGYEEFSQSARETLGIDSDKIPF